MTEYAAPKASDTSGGRLRTTTGSTGQLAATDGISNRFAGARYER
jgi:hypothetical protein